MKKLFIDLEKCYRCHSCTAQCSYYYHPTKDGYVRCLALAAQEHVCRRCEEPPCVVSCPQNALEKRPDGMLNRYSLRCSSCKTCTVACPFGVIYPQLVEYKTTMCDYCFDRADDRTPPLCVTTCPEGALQWVDRDADPENDIHAVRSGQFLVHTVKWKK
jgi:Fe-S-cluster-containing dehydrogenase component